MDKDTHASSIFKTKLGWVGAAVSQHGVVATSLPEPDYESAADAVSKISAKPTSNGNPLLHEVENLIIRYCAGENVHMEYIPVDHGKASEFTIRARQACRSIPRGQTRSYRWLAQQASDSNGAARAAGRVMATNPVPIIIPCHRVIGSDGKLHGFGGSIGLPLKAQLLEMENRNH